MKSSSLSLTLSFFFFAFITKFSLAFAANVEPVKDRSGNPISPDRNYAVVRDGDHFLSSGGLVLRNTKGINSPKENKPQHIKCPVIILQHYDFEETPYSIPVKFTIPGKTPPKYILTGTQLEIEFTKNKTNCAKSSKWLMFVDKETQKTYLGIGGPKNYPNKQIMEGTFSIERYLYNSYKIQFCSSSNPSCSYIGRFGDAYLILTKDNPGEFVFIDHGPHA